MLHTKFWQTAQWFWRRRCLKSFSIYGHGGHLGHVNKHFRINIHFLPPSPHPLLFPSSPNNHPPTPHTHTHTQTHTYTHMSFYMKFGSKWHSGFWETKLKFLNLGQGQCMTLNSNTHIIAFTHLVDCIWNDLDLQYTWYPIYSFSWLHLEWPWPSILMIHHLSI